MASKKTGRRNTNAPRTRAQRIYQIDLTGGGLVIQQHPAGWLEVDVTFDGRTLQFRAEFTDDPGGTRVHFRSEMPDWLADIVADDLGERWKEFRDQTIAGLLDGSIEPEPQFDRSKN